MYRTTQNYQTNPRPRHRVVGQSTLSPPSGRVRAARTDICTGTVRREMTKRTHGWVAHGFRRGGYETMIRSCCSSGGEYSRFDFPRVKQWATRPAHRLKRWGGSMGDGPSIDVYSLPQPGIILQYEKNVEDKKRTRCRLTLCDSGRADDPWLVGDRRRRAARSASASGNIHDGAMGLRGGFRRLCRRHRVQEPQAHPPELMVSRPCCGLNRHAK